MFPIRPVQRGVRVVRPRPLRPVTRTMIGRLNNSASCNCGGW